MIYYLKLHKILWNEEMQNKPNIDKKINSILNLNTKY